MKHLCWTVIVIICPAFLFGQTKLRLHDTASDVSGYKIADGLLGPANTTAVTNTTASGTDIQVTKTGGGTALAWITPPLQTAVTISGTVTCNIYGGESATAANTAFRCRLFKYTGGSEGSSFLTANMATELNTTTTTARNWTGTPTSTAFSAGDRIVIKLFLENCATSGCPTGTMGGSQTATVGYDGTTDGSNAASWVQTNENVVFQPTIVQNSLIGTDTVTAVIPAIASAVGNAHNCTNNAAASCTTATWSATAGNMVACSASTFNQTITSISDNNSTNFVNVLGGTTGQATPGNGQNYMYYLGSIAGGASYSVTAHASATAFVSLVCEEFHPASGALTLDVKNSAQPNNTTAGSVTISSVTNNDMIVEGASWDDTNTITAGTGYTLPTNGIVGNATGQAAALIYNLQVGSGSQTATMNHASGNVGWGVVGAAFKLAVAANVSLSDTSAIGSDSIAQLKGFGGPITENIAIGTISVTAVAIRNRGITETTAVTDSLGSSGGTAVTYTWSHITAPTNPPLFKTWNFGLNYDDQHQCLLSRDGNDSIGAQPIYSNSMFCYNSGTHTFTQLFTSGNNTSTCVADTSTVPSNRHPYNQHAFDPNGHKYYESSGSCNGALAYDQMAFAPTATSGTWTQLSNPTPNSGSRQESQSTFVPGTSAHSGHDSIMVFGGLLNASNRNDTWMYDISANIWSEVCDWSNSPICTVPIHGGAYIVFDNFSKKVVLTGGYNGSGNIVSPTWLFDPSTGTDTWTQPTLTTDLPASAYPCATYDSVRSRLLVIANNSELWEYRVWKNTWTKLSTSGGPTLTANTFADTCGYDPSTDKLVFWDAQAGNGVWELAFGSAIKTADISETISVTPSITESAAQHSAISETTSVTPSVVIGVGRFISETTTQSDSIVEITGAGRIPTVTITTTPSVTAIAAHVAAISESITTAMSIGEQANVSVIMSDTMPPISDSSGKFAQHFSAMSNTLTTTPSVAAVHAANEPISETLTTSPAVTALSLHGASMTETLNLSDNVSRSVQSGNVNRSITETANTSDSLSQNATLNKFISDSLTISDAVTNSHFVNLSETTSVNAIVSRSSTSGGILRGVSETVTSSDAVTSHPNYVEGLGVILGTFDVLSINKAIHKTENETTGVSDGITIQVIPAGSRKPCSSSLLGIGPC
jgi:hypothetical protein